MGNGRAHRGLSYTRTTRNLDTFDVAGGGGVRVTEIDALAPGAWGDPTRTERLFGTGDIRV
jgi:hypothetical protein